MTWGLVFPRAQDPREQEGSYEVCYDVPLEGKLHRFCHILLAPGVSMGEDHISA